MLLRTPAGRRAASAAGVLALTTALTATAGPAAAAPADRAAAGKPGVVSLFPTDALTVPDPGQLTGRRVSLPLTGCGAPVVCGLVQQLNQLDGFDLDPRIAVRFGGPVDPAEAARRISLRGEDGLRVGVDRVVWDPATSTLYAHPAEQLSPSTTYRLRVQGGPANRGAQTVFTTASATDGLLDIADQIEDGSALAGLEQRGLRVEAVVPAVGTQVVFRQDRGPGPLVDEPVPTPLADPRIGAGARYVFGSYLAPSWLRSDVTIAQTPTEDDGPAPTGVERLPFIAVLPAGTPPAGGFPVAVYGHGFTRSAADVFLASVANAQDGLATVATDVVGHGYGERGTWEVTTGTTTRSIPAYARGVDQDGGGAITSTEGSSATGLASAIGNRDALRQTVADVMTLVRSVGGTDVDGDGRSDLSGRGVTYFGQSFGGIYGTMLAGVDRDVARSVLNVPGGPITEVARLGAFRPLTALTLQAAGILPPGTFVFDEQLPLKGDGPVTATSPTALAVQDLLADITWASRSGSPETFAPLIRPQRVIVQVAYGDETVPNPTSYTIADAGDFFDRVSLFRNDKAKPPLGDPHGFLLQLDHPSALQGQQQVSTFLRTGRTIDPDGAGAVWEVPVADPSVLLELNFP